MSTPHKKKTTTALIENCLIKPPARSGTHTSGEESRRKSRAQPVRWARPCVSGSKIKFCPQLDLPRITGARKPAEEGSGSVVHPGIAHSSVASSVGAKLHVVERIKGFQAEL